MPAKAKELSALAVARLKETGRYAVGGVDGLHLNVEGNSRVWILRIVVGKRFNKNGVLTSHRRDIGLGSYPEVSLAEARAKARELREMVRKGIDPIAHKREQIQLMYLQKLKEKTFRQCAEVVISNKTKNLRNEKHIAQWSSSLETYVYPALGERAIASITKIDIASVLEPIWSTKHDTASRIRGRLETIFDYAKAMEYIVGDNPAMWKGNLEPILGTIKKDPKPHSSLPYDQIQSFMQHLKSKSGIGAKALEFAILTVCRSGEVFGAQWAEIDFSQRLWIVPKERMKAEREHRVPLSDQALKLLMTLKIHPTTNGYIFPSPNKVDSLSDMALTSLIKRMHNEMLKLNGVGYIDPKQNRIITTHGFRSTFRDWSADKTSYPREVCEHVLAHKLPDEVEAAYLRGAYLEKRIGLINDWADFCQPR